MTSVQAILLKLSQFVYMVDKVKEYNYKKIGFILDRRVLQQRQHSAHGLEWIPIRYHDQRM